MHMIKRPDTPGAVRRVMPGLLVNGKNGRRPRALVDSWYAAGNRGSKPKPARAAERDGSETAGLNPAARGRFSPKNWRAREVGRIRSVLASRAASAAGSGRHPAAHAARLTRSG